MPDTAMRTVSIHIRPDDHQSLPFIGELVGFLSARDITVLLQEIDFLRDGGLSRYIADAPRFVSAADLVVVIGGDGTFLRAARLFAETNCPIFGINRGRLGFLTEFSPEEAFEHLEKVLKGDYTVTARSMLEAVLVRDGRETRTVSFINDAVISKGAFSRPIRLRLELDGKFLNSYSGDGLIIATATGSTAYSLSAGGPILNPSIENVYIVNPICPHTLAMRPMIMPSESVLKAKILSDVANLLLTIDGQEAIPIGGEDEILIRDTEKRINLIPHPNRDFYEIIRQKLGWGKNMIE